MPNIKFSAILLLSLFQGLGQLMAAPVLNSFPTATATILLDFDGHDVNSSMWNYGTAFSCLPAAMTDAQITEAFNRVAEDFRPFNINITTDLAKFLAAPSSQRVRIIITPTSAWYAGVAGIAYVTSFTWGDDTPAFVFSDRLVNDPKRVAEAISHETGHTLGLYHQAAYDGNCTLTSSYSTGIGTGITSWAPIMGNAATKNLTQWNNGATPNGCTYLQDNLSVITTTNGFGYRADDHADDYRNASTVSITSSAFSQSGIISTSTDVDFFNITLASDGNLKISASPYSVGPDFSGANLDIKLMLYNDKGNLISTHDAPSTLEIIIDTLLNAGQYYVQIDGTGNINNENDYGSLGQYTIVGSFIDSAFNTDPKTAPSDKDKKPKKDKTDIEDEYDEEYEEYDEISSSRTTIDAISPEKATNKIFTVIKPFQQPVIIKATAEYHFMLVDNYGSIIMNGKEGAGTKNIDIRHLPTGIYTIRLINSKEKRTERFLNR
jgi:hypothetical protein